MQSGRRFIEAWDLAEALERRGVICLKIEETRPTASRTGGVSDAQEATRRALKHTGPRSSGSGGDV